MKRRSSGLSPNAHQTLAAALLGIFLPWSANSQSLGGNISVFADPSGGSCFLFDEAPRVFSVYVLHTNMSNPNGLIASRFKLVQSGGFQATYTAESITFNHVGSITTGIAIAYDGCKMGSVVLATVTYTGFGNSEACSYLDIVADPAFGGDTAVAQDCVFDLFPAPSHGRFLVNPMDECQPWCLVPAQESSWGKIKALYYK